MNYDILYLNNITIYYKHKLKLKKWFSSIDP